MAAKRYPIGPGDKFKYQVQEPADGLIVTMRAGESLKLDLGGDEAEVIIWGSNCSRIRLCVRSKKDCVKVDRTRDA